MTPSREAIVSPPVIGPRTFFFRVLGWATAIVFLGASLIAPRAHNETAAATGGARQLVISSASAQPMALLATHTFVAKPTSTPTVLRSVDVLFAPITLRQLVTRLAEQTTGRRVEAATTLCLRTTLVGIVELRI